MHLTVTVRINWPVPVVKLLDDVTIAVGGDPGTVRRSAAYPCGIFHMNRVSNEPDQGLAALVTILWTEEPDRGWPEEPEPPALAIVNITTRGEIHPLWDDIEGLRSTSVLAVVRDWLDEQRVPRSAWWWAAEDLGYFPGTVDIVGLHHPHEIRALPPGHRWAPQQT